MSTWTETPVGSGLMVLAEADICPSEWQRSFDRADISTQVILRRSAPADFPEPPAVIVPDPATTTTDQTKYGIEPYERNDLWTQNAADVYWIAGRILATRSAAASMPRIRSVTIDAEASGDRGVDLLSTLSIFTPSRYRGRLQNDRGLVFDSNFFAVGVKHTITAEAWTAEIALDKSYPFEILAPVDYEWDVGLWDHTLWN